MAQKFDFKKIAEQIVKLLDEKGIAVESLLLYGSQASGRATDDSDIDLVILSKDLAKFEPFERLEFLSRIAWKFDLPIEMIGYTPEEVRGKEGKSIFWDEIRKTSRAIYKKAA